MRQDTALDSVAAYLRLLARLGPGGVPALQIKALIAADPLFGHHAAGLAAECDKSSLVSLLQLEAEPRAATLGFRRLQLPVRAGDGFSIETRDALIRICFGDGWPIERLDLSIYLIDPLDLVHPNVRPPYVCSGFEMFHGAAFQGPIPPVILLLHLYRILVADPTKIQLDDAFHDPPVLQYFHELLEAGRLPTDPRPLFGKAD